jgi:hypothetical protein
MNLKVSFHVLGLGLVLCCLTAQHALSQDVHLYEIERGELFTQATTHRPDASRDTSHALYAYIVPSATNSVSSGTLTTPWGATFALTEFPLTNFTTEFRLVSPSGGSLELPASAPKGLYQFDAVGMTGFGDNAQVRLPGPATGILPPHISHFSDLQAVDASQDFTIAVDSFALNPARNYLQLEIFGPDGTLAYSQINSPGSPSSLIFPFTLQPNTTYSAYVSLMHLFARSSHPNDPNWTAAEVRTTRFKIRTLNPAGVFEFSPVCVVANKSSGSATLTVNRTEGSIGVATVDYFSTDGAARANTNYLPVAGTLNFADGETQKTFTVPLLNDGLTNPPLTVHFTLTNATGGASVTNPPHANLTILDAQNPIGQNINACLLAKVEFYAQTNNSPPTQSPLSIASRFYASVHSKFPGACVSATINRPNGGRNTLSFNHLNYQEFLELNDDFPSPTSMNSTWRGGKYKLSVKTLSEGTFSTVLSLGVERKFTVPQLANWDQAQSIDSSLPFTFQWNPFVEATTNDYVRVNVTDDSGEGLVYTPDEFEPGALPGPTQSYTISPNTLAPGKKYFADVIFVKMTGVRTDPATSVRTGIASVHTTSFYIMTTPTPSL